MYTDIYLKFFRYYIVPLIIPTDIITVGIIEYLPNRVSVDILMSVYVVNIYCYSPRQFIYPMITNIPGTTNIVNIYCDSPQLFIYPLITSIL